MAAKGAHAGKIEMVAIERINVVNPRVRNQKVFYDIATNITKVGLKRPITLTSSRSGLSGKDFDLVCGQGRIEAYLACGETHIPALVIDASEEQALIMGLVENLARRQRRPLEILQGIEILNRQGYDAPTIAKKTGLSASYVNDVVNLMLKGEERLLAAVDTGKIPMYLAVRIAENPDDEQRALQEAYESKQLRGNRLLVAKSLMDRRRRRGKGFVAENRVRGAKTGKVLSGQDIVRVFEREVDRKRILTRKADLAANRLMFVTETLRNLMLDENFSTLLKAEGLSTLPKPLAERIAARAGRYG